MIVRQQVRTQRCVSAVLSVQYQEGQYGIDHYGASPLCPNEALTLADMSSQMGPSRPVRERRDIELACEGVTERPRRTGGAVATACVT